VKISGVIGFDGLSPVATDRKSTQPVVSTSSQRIDDPITLSSEARAREAAASHPRFGALSAAAHRDPELARQLAYDYAHIAQQPILDLSEQEAGTGPARYAATGEPVTPERDAYYKQQADKFLSASLSLYNKEMANGTDPADTFDKLIALGDAQSAEFRSIVDWNLELPANR
jgi:hypothetical protein